MVDALYVHVSSQLCFLASRAVYRIKSVSRNRWSLSLGLKDLGPWSTRLYCIMVWSECGIKRMVYSLKYYGKVCGIIVLSMLYSVVYKKGLLQGIIADCRKMFFQGIMVESRKIIFFTIV